jgi:hypothetical protein
VLNKSELHIRRGHQKKKIMKTLKTIFSIIGAIMIFGGLRHLYIYISIMQEVAHIPTTILNIASALASLITGYGLLKLRYWFLYAMSSTIALLVVITYYNQYISDISPNITSYGRLATFFIILIIALVFKDRILKNKK